MYREVSKLVMYRDFGPDSILRCFCDCIRDLKEENTLEEDLVDRVYQGIRKLLEVSTTYGFDRNLWRDYLTFLLLTNENPLTLTAEKKGIEEGSVMRFALQDMEVFARLFVYDFRPVERQLGIDCFSTVTEYHAIKKRKQNYNRNVSHHVRTISDAISAVLEEEGVTAESQENISAAAKKMLLILSDFYRDFGVGMFGLNKAFRLAEGGSLSFLPINNLDHVMLDDLVGYEIQKQKLRENTEAYLAGHRANNCLLYGDAGTGKSTSIKALINEYYDSGLRMVEIYKHQFRQLSSVISEVKHRNYKFIIYMDDLSFEDFEIEYKYLKAVIEGGLESRPDNVLIYATSNRRHLIRETWNDTNDAELEKHRSDTLQEKLSLVDRFGITIPFMKPNKKEYYQIVAALADRSPELETDEETLLREATKWEIAHGGMSGRTAQQFIDYLAGKKG